jgi:hypothetical protein
MAAVEKVVEKAAREAFVAQERAVADGSDIHPDALRLGRVFVADGYGYGVVHVYAGNGLVVLGATARGSLSFKPVYDDVSGEVVRYSACPRLTRGEYSADKTEDFIERLGEQERDDEERAGGAENIVRNYCGKPLPKIVFIGDIPTGGLEAASGILDYSKAVDAVAEFSAAYNACARNSERLLLEIMYGTQTDKAKKRYTPASSEFICYLGVNQKTGVESWCYRKRTGVFFIAGFQSDKDGKRRPQLDVLTGQRAEKVLWGAVNNGNLTIDAFVDLFGEDADVQFVISTPVPLRLKRRIDWTGETYARLLERGVDARLREVADDFADDFADEPDFTEIEERAERWEGRRWETDGEDAGCCYCEGSKQTSAKVCGGCPK